MKKKNKRQTSSSKRIQIKEDFFRGIIDNAYDSLVVINEEGKLVFVNNRALEVTGCSMEELIGADFRDFVAPESRDAMNNMFKELLGGTEFSEIYTFKGYRKDGEKRVYEMKVGRRIEKGEKIFLFAFIHDITEKIIQEEELKQKNKELSALLLVDQMATESIDLNKRLENVLNAVFSVFQTEVGSIHLLTDDRKYFHLFAQRGFSPFFVRKMEKIEIQPGISIEDFQKGFLIVRKEKYILSGIESLKKFKDFEDIKERFIEESFDSMAVVPLFSGRRFMGLLTVASYEGKVFLEEDLKVLENIGLRIGGAIETAILFSETKRREKNLALSYDIAKAVSGSFKLQEILDLTMQKIVEGFNADCGMIFLKEEDSVVLKSNLGISKERIERIGRFSMSQKLAGEVCSTGMPAFIDDIHWGEGKEISILKEEGFISLSEIPITYRGAVLGVLSIGSRKRRIYTSEEKDLMLSIGTQLGAAVDNLKLFQQRERQVNFLTALTLKGKVVGTCTNKEELYERIHQQVGEFIKPANFSLVLLGEDKKTIEIALKYEGGIREAGRRFPYASGLVSHIFETREPVLTSDYITECKRLGVEPAGPSIVPSRSWLGVPLISKDSVLGVLVVWDHLRDNAFGNEEKEVLLTIAAQASVALENVRLLDRSEKARQEIEEQVYLLKRKTKELSTLYEITNFINKFLNPDELMNEVLSRVLEITDFEAGRIFILEPDGNELIGRVSIGLSLKYIEEKPKFRIGEGITGRVAESKCAMVITEPESDLIATENLRREGFVSFVGIPILSKDRLLGIITLASRKKKEIGEDIVSFLSSIGNTLSVALERSNLYNEAKREAEDLLAIQSIGIEISSTLKIERVFELIVETVYELLHADNVAFLEFDEGKRELKVVAYRGKRELPLRQTSFGIDEDKSVIAYVGREGTPLLVPDVSIEPRYIAIFEDIKTEIAVPVFLKGKVIGVLNVESTESHSYDKNTLRLVSTIAGQASIAIENARLYERLEDSYIDTVKALVLAMEAKDPYTRGHSERVRRYAVAIATSLGISEKDVKTISYAALLHDIGKIGLKDEILFKPEKLSPDEFEQMKNHSVIGERLVENISILHGVGEIIRNQHENYSGGGYPDGLKGEEIPIGARIVLVADAFDAMTTDRLYRKKFSFDEAIEELKRYSGIQFDPVIVETIVRLMKEEKKDLS